MNNYPSFHEKKEYLSTSGVNIVFLIGTLALFIVDILMNLFMKGKGIKIGPNIFYLIALITEFLFILLPAYLYVVYTKKNIRKVLRINKLSLANVLIIIGIAIFLMPLTGFVNYIVIYIVSMIGRPIPNPILDIGNLKGFLVGTAVIAGSAGVCEEVMFRGVILRGYEKYGRGTALIVTSLLFAVMHRNIQNVIGIFFIGLVIGYIVYRTNSIFAGMIAHFTNNAIVVLIMYGFNMLSNKMGIDLNELAQKQQAAGMPRMDMMAAILWFVIVGFSAVVFIGLLTLLRYNTRDMVQEQMDLDTYSAQHKEDIGWLQYGPLMIGLSFILIKFIQDVYYILSLSMPEWMKLI
jgi:membrane protease YdiL (CAAX protease family)